MTKKELYETKSQLEFKVKSLQRELDDQSLKVKRQADHIDVLQKENARLKAKAHGPQPEVV